jgi:hypothetical protein
MNLKLPMLPLHGVCSLNSSGNLKSFKISCCEYSLMPCCILQYAQTSQGLDPAPKKSALKRCPCQGC